MWFDHVSGIGLFEPVGTHPDHRRIGLGRALMAEGLRRMQDAGLTHGLVMYEGGNESSGPLYRGMGFSPTWRLLDYRKPVAPGR